MVVKLQKVQNTTHIIYI